MKNKNSLKYTIIKYCICLILAVIFTSKNNNLISGDIYGNGSGGGGGNGIPKCVKNQPISITLYDFKLHYDVEKLGFDESEKN